MVDNKAQGLVLAPGRPVSLLLDSGPRAVTKDPVAAPQILALVREVVPAGEQARLGGSVATTFQYAAPSGAVTLEVIPENDGTRVVIRPDGGTPAAPAPAPAAS